MTTFIVKAPASASSRAAAHELPIITAPSGNQLLVDARLLHQRLKVTTRFNDWVSRQIKLYRFEDGKDFYSNLSKSTTSGKNLPKRKSDFDYSNLSNRTLIGKNLPTKSRGGDRRSIDYHFTIDAAKELALLQCNEVGRAIRRYFIEAEAELRTKRIYAQTASITDISKRIKPIEINGRKLYKLRPLRQLLGYSTRTSTSNIRRCNEGLLVIFNHEAYVAEEYVKVMISNSTCRALRAEAKAAKPVLQLEFNFKQKGGAHAH